jgi:pyruvate dehydrogenase E1 component alpha subunit
MVTDSARTAMGRKPTAAAPPEGSSAQRVASFEVRLTRCLDPQGRALGPLPEFAHDAEQLRALYRHMTLTRAFDHKAILLQRTGQLGTYASSLGEEAIGTGVAAAMRREDVLLPAYRQHAAQFLRGVHLSDVLLYWGGDERGMAFAHGGAPAHDFPTCVPVASHAPHAVGVAYAFKLRREPRVAVCLLGDGGTSKGDFYEALNAAGAWQLPLVFVIENNQWAISVPRELQSHAETLAQKAIAAGIPGEQVDGNDLIAVRAVAGEAIERARRGQGPSLIEALTYRLGDHTTADDASRYRSAEEVKAQQQYDPLARLRAYLTAAGHWSDAQEARLEQECAQAVEDAVKEYLATPPRAPETMFDHLYDRLPDAFAAQREALTQVKEAARSAHGSPSSPSGRGSEGEGTP